MSEMLVNNIWVRQQINWINAREFRNEYHFWAENGTYLGALAFPPNGQFMFDSKILDHITKALALRWGLISQPRKR